MKFNKIWSTQESHLLNFIKTKVNNEHIAKDILQEVSIKLLTAINKKTVIKNYKTWLFQVSRNTIADYYRKNKKQLELSASQLTANNNSSTCVCDLSEFVIKNYLPAKYSKPLFLSDIERKPQQEIADILNLTLTATKSRIQRARIKLKETVSECIHIYYNERGQIIDFSLKKECNIPPELKAEIERLNLIL